MEEKGEDEIEEINEEGKEIIEEAKELKEEEVKVVKEEVEDPKEEVEETKEEDEQTKEEDEETEGEEQGSPIEVTTTSAEDGEVTSGSERSVNHDPSGNSKLYSQKWESFQDYLELFCRHNVATSKN